jgi:oxygen-independent coproporphyrinogen-3 oxidase
MLRLRTTHGISAQEYEKQYLLPFDPIEEALMKCADHHLAIKSLDDRWHLTAEGFLVSNSIISDLLLIQEQSEPLAKRRQ